MDFQLVSNTRQGRPARAIDELMEAWPPANSTSAAGVTGSGKTFTMQGDRTVQPACLDPGAQQDAGRQLYHEFKQFFLTMRSSTL